jgi:hypothetical protein
LHHFQLMAFYLWKMDPQLCETKNTMHIISLFTR